MGTDFKGGDVTRENSKPGDVVYYVTSRARGNSTYHHTWYNPVEIARFTEDRVCIDDTGKRGVYVNEWHLFTRNALMNDSVRMKNLTSKEMLRVVKDSICVQKDGKDFVVNALDLESDRYRTLVRFSGPGKLKKAKDFEACICSCIIPIVE